VKLLKQNLKEPNCLVYSAAMCMNTDPEEIFKFCGHRGQEIWWPEVKGNAAMRGFHIQEMIAFGLNIGYALILLELYPQSAPRGYDNKAKYIYEKLNSINNFFMWLKYFDAILITATHAVAWNHRDEICYDPNGLILEINRYEIIEAWLVTQIKSK
jgi:hypothetical protein